MRVKILRGGKSVRIDLTKEEALDAMLVMDSHGDEYRLPDSVYELIRKINDTVNKEE